MTEQKQEKTIYTITTAMGKTFNLVLAGRNRWAMEQLMKAGTHGCTPINNPAPRWSAYAFNLREFGVPIETVTERHAGPYPGHHARYVLQAQVQRGDGGAT
ncbi:hypothetical protein SAMN05444000_13812 [Shimia gijangensis]|uniref:Winged helix domain-containing protein n=1 Tax=Shimia gijangensis TaxID=1470563 RepID=A0A1M6TDM7_9RHOB|nr:hypothetical protein [Shimia gijangensis]SHK55063.1 hypothetical protein SAMN05444000_13812 [Shimia gijangensis]